MYQKKEIDKAIKTYFQLGSERKSIRVLGYPDRATLRSWIREYRLSGKVEPKNGSGRKHRFDLAQQKQAVQYYLSHGRNITQTLRALGYPGSQVTLRTWIRTHAPKAMRDKVRTVPQVKHSEEIRMEAVAKYRQKKSTAIAIAREYGVTRTTLYAWVKEFPLPVARDESLEPMPSKKRSTVISKSSKVTEKVALSSKLKTPDTTSASELSVAERLKKALAQVAKLERQVNMLSTEAQTLQEDVYKLQMQKDVLVKCAELLKKDPGVNLENLSNRDKALVIDALRSVYKLADLLPLMGMSKSSYCYQAKVLRSPDKYATHREKIKDIFSNNYRCYGYRRIKASLQHLGMRISEKVVRRLMRDDGLQVRTPKQRKYSSYQGEITPEVPNVVARDFHASAPNQKWLTDITEFALPDGKVYLSPLIDCYDGMPVAWTVGTSPNAELVNTMLRNAISQLTPGEKPIIHSDRGCHYRWPEWIAITQQAGLTRSMSKKGCSPDNSACEGFFGRMKNEMFYGRSWLGTTCAEFIDLIHDYMTWYKEDRVKISLGGLSPQQYRQSQGFA